MIAIRDTSIMRDVASLAAGLVNFLANFLRALRNRREIDRLAEMSDAELADIGLIRSDLSVVSELPAGIDPTASLGMLVEKRRRASDKARCAC